MRLKPSDVWDLTEKAGGDHVLIALTVEECVSLMTAVDIAIATSNDPPRTDSMALDAKKQIRLSLRDQKDIVA